ncbi:MAG: single-stranded DNA-binding protein [Bacteroidales bacterium]|nr:single-stranded DNA-binding protein [Bacteroidales bacterium]MBR5832870.1 single-stranded DNA-binding protein [Bacteroidales bacterium]
MVGVNKVILIGNLGKDPEIITFDTAKKAIFPLATTEFYRNKEGQKVEQTDWHNIVCWRSLAEISEKILKKGTQIYLEGKLRTRSWEDKEGNKRYITEVLAENFTVLANRNYAKNQDDIDLSPIDDILNDNTEPLEDLPF